MTPPGNITERNGRAINRAVTRALERRFTDRFFLYVHYMEVHDYLASDAPYAKGVVNADAAVGELLEKLDDLDLLDDAVVILTSDHGERLGERQVLPGTLSHFGNPSFEQLLQVPLIVSPARFDDTESLVRGDQVYNMIRRIVGLPEENGKEVHPGEHFVSEDRYVTYRNGRWKSFQNRKTGELVLVDLQSDPGEKENVADAHPAVRDEHIQRTRVIARSLASSVPPVRGFSELDKERLRSLGYLE